MSRPRPETVFSEYSDEEIESFIEDVASGGSVLSGKQFSELNDEEKHERLDALARRVELLLEYNKRQLDAIGD